MEQENERLKQRLLVARELAASADILLTAMKKDGTCWPVRAMERWQMNYRAWRGILVAAAESGATRDEQGEKDEENN